MSVPRSLASLAGQSRSLATASTAPLYPPGLADVFDPTPAPRPAGLLPTPASTRTARLESHYLNTLREDLMILHYDNSSRALATLEQDPEWTDGVKVPDDLLKRVFSADDRIARDRVKGGGLARYGT